MATPKKKYVVAQTPLPEAKIDAVKRIRREGKKRSEAFNLCRENHKQRLLKTGDWGKQAANEEAWALAIGEYPPLPVDQWEEVQEVPLRRVEWVPPPCDVSEELARLPATTSRNLRDAYMWVGDHPAMHRQGIGPFKVVCLTPEDIRGCPCPFAWNLLQQAIKDPSDFFKAVTSKFLKLTDAGKPAEDEVFDPASQDEGCDDLEGLFA